MLAALYREVAARPPLAGFAPKSYTPAAIAANIGGAISFSLMQ
jgi:hypothetical protein